MKINSISTDELDRRIEKLELEGSLIEYVKWSFEKKFKTEFVVNHHHITICNTLEKVFRGDIQNLIINMPPRYSKTELAVKCFIEWSMAKVADCRFIHLSYSDTLALDSSSEIREDIKSDWYQHHWPLKTKSDSDTKKKWHTTSGGGLYATGTLGSITGFGAGRFNQSVFGGAIIIDDPLKPDEAYSDVKRKAANNRLNSTILSRRNNKKVPIIIIMQRLHQEDMSGFCMDGGTSEKFTILSIPAMSPEGVPLWPEKHSIEQLKAMEKADRRMFAGQYMQTPSPEEGTLFKRQYWQFYKRSELPKSFHSQAQAWDFSVKEKDSADFTVGLVGGRVGASKYLLDMTRDKMNFPKQCTALINLSMKWRSATKKLVEDKANGSPILDTLKKQVSGMIPIQPVGDKVFRANAVLPEVESGCWFLPHPDECPWIVDFIEELAVFPNGKHDDMVDAFTMLAKEFQMAPIAQAPISGHGSGTIY